MRNDESTCTSLTNSLPAEKYAIALSVVTLSSPPVKKYSTSFSSLSLIADVLFPITIPDEIRRMKLRTDSNCCDVSPFSVEIRLAVSVKFA